ncbi:MAG: hypothetical protein GY769_10505 [bacterium]|nr:hypothetical protein [bacterium]
MNLARPARRSLPGLLSWPLFWLLVQAACVFLLLEISGSLEATVVPDTPSYRQAALAPSLSQALTSHRTLGYPLFMKSLGLRADRGHAGNQARHGHRVFRRIPPTQALVFLAAVLLLWLSIRVYTGSAWLALAFVSPLYYASIWRIVDRIQPDFLAAALALVSVSLLLLVASRPRTRLLWIALTLSVFATYLVRPGYVFLVALIPLMGVLLRLAYANRRLASSLILGLGLLAATALPFLSFNLLRWTLVGDFALVSFGGYNLIGVTASLLDRSLVDGLSRNRDLADDILRDRELKGWQPMPLGGDILVWHSQHNFNIYRIAVGHAAAGIQTQRASDDLADRRTPHIQIETNRVLKRLSWDIIRKKPLHYAQWVRDTVVVSMLRTVAEPGIRWPAILTALSLPFGLRLRRAGAYSTDSETTRKTDRLLVLSVLGLTFFLLHAILVALVDLPYPRFFYAMVLLLPSVLCGVLFEIWRSIDNGLRRRGVSGSVLRISVVPALALVLVPNAMHLYRGAVSQTTAEAASLWIRKTAGFLSQRTVATETSPLNLKARESEGPALVPLELHWHELSEPPPLSLDLADFEVFPESRLDGPDRHFYLSRIERIDARNVATLEAQLFRRRGPTLVVLAHPWRVYGGRAGGKVPTLHPVAWSRRTKQGLQAGLPSRFRAGQVISLDVSLSWEQIPDCELTLGGEKVELHAYRRSQHRPSLMTPRTLLATDTTSLLFECPDSALMSPEPAVSVIRWLPTATTTAG